MIFITFLITAAKLNAVHEVEIILRDPEWFLQLPIKHMANIKVGQAGSRLVDWLRADVGVLLRPQLAPYLLSSALRVVTT